MFQVLLDAVRNFKDVRMRRLVGSGQPRQPTDAAAHRHVGRGRVCLDHQAVGATGALSGCGNNISRNIILWNLVPSSGGAGGDTKMRA